MAQKKTKVTAVKKVAEEQKMTVSQHENRQVNQPKTQECPQEVSLLERKVLSLCIAGAYGSVADKLKNYKWRDKVCSRIAGGIRYCIQKNINVNPQNVQLATYRVYPDTLTEIKYVSNEKLAPNMLIPVVNKLLTM